MLKLGSNTTQPRKKFQYVEIVLTNRGWQNKEIATWIGKANTVLLYRSMVTKREFSSTEKLSIFKSVFVRILTDGCETWVTTERVLYQVQAAVMGSLRRVQEVSLCYKVHNCEVRKTQNIEPILQIERSQLRWVGHATKILQVGLARQVRYSYTYDKAVQWPTKDQMVWFHLRPCLVPSWNGASGTNSGCWKLWVISSPARAVDPATLPRGKASVWWWMNELWNLWII